MIIIILNNMGKIIAKFRKGEEIEVDLPFDVGDYVKVSNTGQQYTTYNNAVE